MCHSSLYKCDAMMKQKSECRYLQISEQCSVRNQNTQVSTQRPGSLLLQIIKNRAKSLLVTLHYTNFSDSQIREIVLNIASLQTVTHGARLLFVRGGLQVPPKGCVNSSLLVPHRLAFILGSKRRILTKLSEVILLSFL